MGYELQCTYHVIHGFAPFTNNMTVDVYNHFHTTDHECQCIDKKNRL